MTNIILYRNLDCDLYYSVILILLNSTLRSRRSWKRLLPSNMSCLKSGTSTGKSYSSVSVHTHTHRFRLYNVNNSKLYYGKEMKVELKN